MTVTFKPAAANTKTATASATSKKVASKVATTKTVVANKAPVAKKTVSKPAATPASTKKTAPVKTKTVRETFKISEADYALIAMLKKTAIADGLKVKKSELLRGGLLLLSQLKAPELKKLLSKIQAVQA